ncbi:FHA domain-containing protein [Gryllotalpicola protaetiae]|uniref:FHA domain-containing protein n=1 Tax=Gryllotalpicola protaetiae TaxID=2419771 RepID=A0A387BGL6_9MICO|nr:FHA domain-containing protein [Gryllotalpicola protaetiae]AYG03063.1 FHA domain-containing protein [Gryllotalpicola protaetiae]
MLRVHATAPGGWLTVAIPGTLLLVEAASARPLDPDELLAALHADDAIPAALDVLTAGGFSSMPAFALLEYRGQSAHYVVRGAVELEFTGPSGPCTASGAGITTWTEQLISGVDGFTVSASDAGDGAALPLADGVIWGDRVRYQAADASATASAELPLASAARSAAGAQRPTGPLLQAPAAAEETLLPASIDEETVITPLPAVAAAQAPEDSTPIPEGTTGYDHLFGITQLKSVESAAVRPHGDDEAEAEPVVVDAGDHDGLTLMSGDIAELRKKASASAAGRDDPAGRRAADAEQAMPARVGDSADPQFRIELPDGRSELLDRPVVVGRSPSANKVSGSGIPRLVTVGAADADISRNHVRFTVEGGTVVITDLHSRNGTLMSLPGRPPQKLREGEPTSALAGTIVDLGGGIRITVVESGRAADR